VTRRSSGSPIEMSENRSSKTDGAVVADGSRRRDTVRRYTQTGWIEKDFLREMLGLKQHLGCPVVNPPTCRLNLLTARNGVSGGTMNVGP
jgi:hypothetical protein